MVFWKRDKKQFSRTLFSLLLVVFVVLVVGGVFGAVSVVGAVEPLTDLPSEIQPDCDLTDLNCIWRVFIANIFNAFLGFVKTLFLLILQLLLWVGRYNGFLDSPVVTVGWKLVRDVANMFFILILLLIAFSTILGSEKLSYKQHLKTLLLMALLINFSKMITGILIDFSQVVMLTFGNALVDAGGLLGNTGFVGVGKLNAGESVNFFGLLMNTILGIIFLLCAIMVVGAMFVLLLGRILFLWILIVLSPFAFLLSAFPQGQKYAGQWWQELSKNLISGPVLMFFLWLSLSVQEQLQAAFSGLNTIDTVVTSSEIGTADSFVMFAVSMGLLLAGIKFAVDAGGAGAGAVGAVGSFIKARGRGMLGTLDRAVARGDLGKILGGQKTKLGRTVGKYSSMLSPTVIKKGWEAYQARQDRFAYPVAAGRFEDLVNKRFNARLGKTGGAATLAKGLEKVGLKDHRYTKWLANVREGGEKSAEERIAMGTTSDERLKEILSANYSAEEIAGLMAHADNPVELMALTKAAMKGKNQDDVTRIMHELQKQGLVDSDETPGGKDGTFDAMRYNKYLRAKWEKVMGKDQAKQMAALLPEYAESMGTSRPELGIAKVDDSGKVVWSDEWQRTTLDDENNDIEDMDIEKMKRSGKTTIKIKGQEFKIETEDDREKALLAAQKVMLKEAEEAYGYVEGQLQGKHTRALRLKDKDGKRTQLSTDNDAQKFFMARNMADNMLFRMNRGNAEQWVSNLGAAELREQYTDKELIRKNGGQVYGELTMLGRIMVKELPSAYQASINRTRQFQGRTLQFAGVLHSQKYTEEEARDLGMVKGMTKVDPDRFAEAYALNPSATAEIIGRVKFTNEQGGALLPHLQEAYERRQAIEVTLGSDEGKRNEFLTKLKQLEEDFRDSKTGEKRKPTELERNQLLNEVEATVLDLGERDAAGNVIKDREGNVKMKKLSGAQIFSQNNIQPPADFAFKVVDLKEIEGFKKASTTKRGATGGEGAGAGVGVGGGSAAGEGGAGGTAAADAEISRIAGIVGRLVNQAQQEGGGAGGAAGGGRRGGRRGEGGGGGGRGGGERGRGGGGRRGRGRGRR